ncbi:hypothetical protein N1851_010647 [Merluccius polli]|uniref:CCHC-type domain-containing protein n=1 Tax=Merluccius polli TaxID=89951 RepID=A0AA47MYC6_MERPO|nr:hypothetical protein N1851_010647 [Merluccius polli]
MRAVPGGETDKSTLYPTLANDQPVLTNSSSPPPYMIHSHPPDETMHQHTMVTMATPTDKSRMTRDGPAVLHQHPLLTIRNGPVSIAYSGPMYKTARENDTDDLRGSSRTPGKWTEMVIEGRSGPGAIMGREPLDPSRNSSRRHRDEEPCRTVRSTRRQGGIRQRYEEESWNRGDYREGEETQYEEMLSDTEDESYSNREAHTRARYQERRNDDRARNWPRDPDNLGYGMESGRRGREMEEAHQDDTRQDQQREPNNRQDLIPGQRSERQTWTQGESSLLMGCDTEEEPPRDDREDTFRENQVVGKSQTLRLDTRVKSLPPPLVTHHSMTTRPRRPDPWSPITSDHPQAMGCTPNPRNSSQFNTPNRDRSIDCSASQTRPCRLRQYTIEDFMAPLLTDGAGREVYTPWGHRDMHTLANSLPPLTAGAQAWVRKFEMETSGDNLALGDVRAIISRTHGPRRTNELERLAGTTNLADRTPLDPYRNHLWNCLRELFPGDMKKAGISNIHIKPEENIYQYIQRAEDLWVDRNDGRPSDSRIGLQMFQEALIKGLTPAVQKTLKMVASLDYMKWDRWVEQLVHHYHLDQERQEEKSGEYEDLKLVLLKMKIKEQADLNKKAKNTQEPSTMMPLATTPPAPQASAPTTSNTAPQVAYQASVPVTPVPNAIPTVVYQVPAPQGITPPGGQAFNYPGLPYALPPQQYGQTQYQNQGYRGRGRRGRGGTRLPSLECFYCGQLGHWMRDCPIRISQIPPPQQLEPQNPQQGPPPPGAPMYPVHQ